VTTSVPFVQSMHAAALQRRLPGSGLAWLDAARAEALQAFAARGLPGQRNELWKYTSLRALAQRAYAASDAGAPTVQNGSQPAGGLALVVRETLPTTLVIFLVSSCLVALLMAS